MEFGPVSLARAEGATLAHSLVAEGLRLKKGRRLSAADLAALEGAGIAEVTVARLGPGDLDEDAAAAAVARALAPEPEAQGLSVSAPFTGRVNLFAAAPGLLRVDRAAVDRLNAVDPAITLATLADWSRVAPRQMVATVKIIPYGVAGDRVAAAGEAAAGVLSVTPFRALTASLILTRTPGFKQSLIAKGERAIRARMEAMGARLVESVAVAHETGAVAEAIRSAAGDLILILGGSATSDARDTCPAGLAAAGGALVRFGMPVDPGNLLFLGRLGERPVVGLPGSARSPALSGIDWVLERLVAGIAVTGADIAAMGVGGLLKEIPTRGQPRAVEPGRIAGRPRVEAVVLAAGAGRRMGGRDKLLEPVAGQPILRRVASAALASGAERVVAVLPPGAAAREAALDGLEVERAVAPDWAEGMAASLRAGLAAVSPGADAVAILLADMPEVTAEHLDRLIAAFDPAEGREICRALSASGQPGHPVLFGRRFFETLAGLSGDRGARDILREAAELVVDVPTPGEAAVVDLDTPEAWAAWRAGAG